MAPRWSVVKELVEENSVDEFFAASRVLMTIANNVLEHPNETKFRKIRIGNANVQSKLLTVNGGMECLFGMGFIEAEDGEFLILPEGTSLDALRSIKEELRHQETTLQATAVPKERTGGHEDSSRVSQTLSSAPASVHSLAMMQSEASFLAQIQAGMSRVMHYEDSALKEKTRAIIPHQQLQVEALAKFESRRDSSPSVDMRHYFLLGLLHWFKKSFFKWVDSLPCSSCGGSTRNTGSLTPSADDLRWGANRVEAHTCETCTRVTRFPRYTRAEKLLETRRGRCGEWADCFTLCCRAMDFEARYAMDWTDHVWTEVFSVSQNRWLHCDPCENICDKPLLYESGWGKKLTYVIAFAKDDIQDVTWRYSKKHKEVLSRRTKCRESWLRHTIHRLWYQKLSAQSESRQKELWLRLIAELVEFLTTKNESPEALPGRSTGSLAWRQARGELGSQADGECLNVNYVFTPTDIEKEKEVIHICYSCAQDKYFRRSSEGKEILNWQTCVNSAKNIFRKEEYDWKMVYLAREEGSGKAEISWKFDLTGADLRISKVVLKATTAVFENGSILWKICGDDSCYTPNGTSLQQFMTFDLQGSQTLAVSAVLEGGRGEPSWQHTQLFRQSEEDDAYPLDIKLFLS